MNFAPDFVVNFASEFAESFAIIRRNACLFDGNTANGARVLSA